MRDLPILDATTWLIERMTTRFAESVARLAQLLAIKQVATWFGLSWDTVQAIDEAAMERRSGPIDLTGVCRIAIDEFAIQKGHRYATSVVDPTTRRVLWVGRGRRREDLRPFFELPGRDGCACLEVAVMDMSEEEDRYAANPLEDPYASPGRTTGISPVSSAAASTTDSSTMNLAPPPSALRDSRRRGCHHAARRCRATPEGRALCPAPSPSS